MSSITDAKQDREKEIVATIYAALAEGLRQNCSVKVNDSSLKVNDNSVKVNENSVKVSIRAVHGLIAGLTF